LLRRVKIWSRWLPFGSEYSLRKAWGRGERYYIMLFGMIDLPTRIRAHHIIKEVRKLRWERMYDIGCGTGVWSFYFSRDQSKSIQASDVDGGRIEECQRIASLLNRGNVLFKAASAQEILANTTNDSIDVALSIEVLNCIEDLKGTLEEFRRVLKPGGCLVAHVPIRKELRPYEKWLFEDRFIHQTFNGVGFESLCVRPTFGLAAQALSGLFDKLSRYRIFMALCFPLLLMLSWVDSFPGQSGGFRLIVARKPLRSTIVGRLESRGD
jgi:ubiquinone/menaquinone biosynthesis C-methylase UbiE